jgi:hypothetical protein
MPLVLEGDPARNQEQAGDLRRRLRKVKPQFTEGELVKVAGARNQTEAEFIQGLLLEEGVPSILRRMRGFDVPDFLAAGPRDILVPHSGVQAARQVLLQSELGDTLPSNSGPIDAPWRVLGWLVVGLLVAALVAAVVARL